MLGWGLFLVCLSRLGPSKSVPKAPEMEVWFKACVRFGNYEALVAVASFPVQAEKENCRGFHLSAFPEASMCFHERNQDLPINIVFNWKDKSSAAPLASVPGAELSQPCSRNAAGLTTGVREQG